MSFEINAVHIPKLRLSVRERITFNLHLGYAACDGLSLGILALNEFILLKNLDANPYQVSMLFQLATLMMPFSIILTNYVARASSIKKLLRNVAWLTRGPLLLLIIFPSVTTNAVWSWAYLFIFALYYLANPFILPSINVFTRANYSHTRYARLFSISQSLTQSVTFVATLITGHLLQFDSGMYRYILPILGVIGIIGIYAISAAPVKFKKIQKRGDNEVENNSIGYIMQRAVNIIKTNKPFRYFQYGMMSYGIGMHMTFGVVALFLVERMQLSFSQIGNYKNIPVFIAIIAYPVVGSILDRRDPHKVAAITYLMCILYLLGLIISDYYPSSFDLDGWQIYPWLLFAFVMYGFFSAGIGLVWTIGSSYYATPGMTGTYHAIHISLTGVRGLFAPFLGMFIYQYFGFITAFSASIFFFILAIAIQQYSRKFSSDG